MTKKLQDRIAIVTGAGGGFGEGIARHFAELGAKVVVADIRGDAAQKVAAGIEASGAPALPVTVDVTNSGAVKAMVDATLARFGRLDILVNNAAVMRRTFLPEVTAELIDAHFNVNVRGYLLAAKHAAELMTAGGCIINVASAISRMAYPGAVVYTATKGRWT